MLLITLSSLRFLLRQGLAIRGHEETEGNLLQILLLRAEHCSDLKYIIDKQYLSGEILNEMIALMSNVVVRQNLMLSEIREVAVFFDSRLSNWCQS